MKLLVVDDHPLVIEGLIGILSSESIIVQLNKLLPKMGLKKIMEQNPDIVLLDIRLGKENGWT